jgi:hypothetical protein
MFQLGYQDVLQVISQETPVENLYNSLADFSRRMRRFAREIRTLQLSNIQRRTFVPVEDLYELMTRDFVSEACTACGLSPVETVEVVDFIMKGARKVFATLILIAEEPSIMQFIATDQYSRSSIDDKIPFRMEALEAIDPGIADSFYKQQWDFSAPYFTGQTSHRLLDDDVVLPFLSEEFIGEGGFGTVHQLVLHRASQSFAQALPDQVCHLS